MFRALTIKSKLNLVGKCIWHKYTKKKGEKRNYSQ